MFSINAVRIKNHCISVVYTGENANRLLQSRAVSQSKPLNLLTRRKFSKRCIVLAELKGRVSLIRYHYKNMRLEDLAK